MQKRKQQTGVANDPLSQPTVWTEVKIPLFRLGNVMYNNSYSKTGVVNDP